MDTARQSIRITGYWLMKCEPDVYSISDLERDKTTSWEGVRNYQARNFMRDHMKLNDTVVFYHSNAKPPGAAGLARVCKTAYPDHFSWDPTHRYFDPQSSPEDPRWVMVDIAFEQKFKSVISIQTLRDHPELQNLMILQKGSRLSITPIDPHEYYTIHQLGLE
ncbi:MAG: EVE domain-containing protein [Flavobacteriaceae bacterium]|nr:EVE domain-containing protein [Flavobacteriaceae bacterium]